MASPPLFTSVLICEDHYVCALGIEAILRKHCPHPIQVRNAPNGINALRLAQEEAPDLVVVDLLLPDISGAEVVRTIRTNSPNTRIIVLTGIDDPHAIRQAYLLKPDALLQKNNTEGNFGEALQILGRRRGKTYLDPSMQRILEITESRPLTPREYEVISFMAKGLTSGEIAKRMKCSVTTVKTYRARIMSKSGARNAAEIMAWFLKGNGKRNFSSNT